MILTYTYFQEPLNDIVCACRTEHFETVKNTVSKEIKMICGDKVMVKVEFLTYYYTFTHSHEELLLTHDF